MKRRTFIQTSAASAAALSLTGLPLSAKSYRRILGANDRIQVAMLGCNRRFPGLLEALAELENVDVIYVSDVDARRQESGAGKVKEATGQMPKQEKDMRKIFDQADVDAVFHATPDHWHAPGAILSLQAGKHVYVEKPCSHNPSESEMLVDWQKHTGLTVQMGTQQRSAPETIEIIKEIHEGVIGEAYLATAFYTNSRGRVPTARQVPVPDYLDWELFQGPAPRTDFIDIVGDYNWHWFWRWGTAETGNNATHELDVGRWALQAKYPEAVYVNAAKNHFKDDPWTMYDTMDATINFPGGKTVKWDGKSRSGHPTYGAGRGTIIYGSEGSVFLNREGYRLYDRRGELLRERKGGPEAGTALGGGGSMTTRHVKNFLETIRGKDSLNCPIEEGATSTNLSHYANVSYRAGNKLLAIDPTNGHFQDKKIMKKYWSRDYEKGWKPEKA
ncbi:MAG TPA: Gfo/Idh/MocA family oxidoreductase [Saprospiraceae bacterium]|nr:Gfo/Idh/MocA family oxidoreductase [Saprospiraceae bacterium]